MMIAVAVARKRKRNNALTISVMATGEPSVAFDFLTIMTKKPLTRDYGRCKYIVFTLHGRLIYG